MSYRSCLRSAQIGAVGRITAEVYRECLEAAHCGRMRVEYNFHNYVPLATMEEVIKRLTDGRLKVRLSNTHRISILWE